ncbi:hypothetical protein A1D22_10215 [Pasteurellaceae bacterium LFhippo2]|nr:hypothetical protein [Pasteurellaceae bacterium LFhippo2]
MVAKNCGKALYYRLYRDFLKMNKKLALSAKKLISANMAFEIIFNAINAISVIRLLPFKRN